MTLTMRQAKAVVEGWHAGLDVGFGGWDRHVSIFGGAYLRLGDGSPIKVDRLYIEGDFLWADGPEALLGFRIGEEGERCPSPRATAAEGSSSPPTAHRCGAGATRARARAPASTRGTARRGTGATGSWTPPSRSTATWTRTRAGSRPSTTCG